MNKSRKQHYKISDVSLETSIDEDLYYWNSICKHVKREINRDKLYQKRKAKYGKY